MAKIIVILELNSGVRIAATKNCYDKDIKVKPNDMLDLVNDRANATINTLLQGIQPKE